ncbi:uncharacterized protein KY384_004198 [Bacidia gigantensis]|uniref:uncharacterized protein n=1 Tax=Bacidia gigantensis TaxID=2732470 RepID=UPI001D054DD8|nr:uncharacterized protein KY384_004198 [Bacidia gigantensis]KAG8530841.1 hypothetical protein KY384_004198 [Bacidia gigantensis]
MTQQSLFSPASSSGPYQQQAGNPAGYSAQAWHPSQTSPAATSEAPFNSYHPTPPIKPEEPYGQHAPTPAVHGLPASDAAEQAQNAAAPMSPQSENGWMSGSSSDHTEKVSKREGIPFFVDNPPRLRPDGVRKKNARFDIPEDRKVDTIDRIILQTDPGNETLLKELKQQKRLLRNRQAALDSRCRKKEHTAKLEEERKILCTNMEVMEEELGHRRQQEQMWMHERAQWQAVFERLNMEKEELVRQHTLETAELRKKNNILLEDVQRRSSLSMSTVPSSAGYSSTFSEFDHLSINESPTWEDFSLLSSLPENEASPQPHTQGNAHNHEAAAAGKDEEKSAASGLLFMLLLCGAWVASKGASSAAAVPQMPDEVRAASTAVLDNIYKDAGLQTSNVHAGDLNQIRPYPQQDGHTGGSLHPTSDPFMTFHQLTGPTHQQQREEAFSLSATQYNAITTDDNSYSTTPQSSPKPRRNLHEALVNMRAVKKGTASETYAKSLLWDEVPLNVVRDFARMVGERNTEPLS